MLNLNKTFEASAFSMNKSDKSLFFSKSIQSLTKFHFENCKQYKKILLKIGFDPNTSLKIEDYPFLPVRLFKDYELLSVDNSKIIKQITSSGTSGQGVSKIFLDRETSTNQTKTLTKITTNFVGTKRLPMLIIDNKSSIYNGDSFSARGAGIIGFSMFGKDITFALDRDMRIDLEVLKNFCEKHKKEKILLFGFTFMIWKHFVKYLESSKQKIDLGNALLVHGGGWKKLEEESVDNEDFKKSLEKVCGIQKVHNYYGMVEQTGSIFIECESGFLHCSNFSDILTRRSDFTQCDRGETGIVELLSLLPKSYPGHIILTEDEGEIVGEDDCSCGRLGKYFRIYGRIKNAEIRGCSDVYPN